MEDFDLSNYVVLFVDLLGQTEKLLKYPVLPSSKQQDEQFQKWLKDTYGTVIEFYKAFDTFLKNIDDTILKISDAKGYKVHDIEIRPVSDSVILFSSLKSTSNTIPALDIFHILLSASVYFVIFLSKGIVFRGAADLGIGMKLPNTGLYGSALVKPYLLETEKADNPRILIGADLYNYLYTIANLNNAEPFGDDQKKLNISKKAAEAAINEMIIKDSDGQFILNYFNKFSLYFILDLIDSSGINFLTNAKDFIKNSLETYANTKVEKKYIYLNNFFETHYRKI